MSNTKQQNAQESKKRGPTLRQLRFMPYMEILEHYHQYPNKNLKYSHFNVINKNGSSNIPGQKNSIDTCIQVSKSKFLTENDKAEGWMEVYPTHPKFSKFLQTNLHNLPKHLWEKMKPFYSEKVLVGYKVKEGSITFFVHMADTDDTSRELFKEINSSKCDKEKVKSLVNCLNERGIESWLTIRANKLI